MSLTYLPFKIEVGKDLQDRDKYQPFDKSYKFPFRRVVGWDP